MTTTDPDTSAVPVHHDRPPTGLGIRPAALLLDFGGVMFSTVKRPDGIAAAASHLAEVLARAGHDIDPERLELSLAAGLAGLTHWKHSMSRTPAPAELTHRQVWEEFLLSDLDPAIAATVAGDAAELLCALSRHMNEHTVRPGIGRLLDDARALGIPVGIVSNAHAGRAHRELLRRHDMEHLVAVQLYSDEVGMRKPNPAMLQMAATALATTPDRCWYVGDTQDRDLVAARRAGIGAVILTESKHTRNPPFPVHERADAVLPTPEGIVDLLAAATPAPARRADADTDEPRPAPSPGRDRRPAALLLDQGGVLTSSTKTPAAVEQLVLTTVDRLAAAGHRVEVSQLREALDDARRSYQARKDETERTESKADHGAVIDEISPAEFWGELVGAHLDAGARAWLLAEAGELMFAYAAAKSDVVLRDGVPELLQWCRRVGIPVAIVSNTICGRSGRARLVAAGVGDLIGAHAYSDEVGRRKPDPALVWAATRALGVDPADCWFVGDKPWRDVVAGRGAGVGTVVVVRDGSPTAERLETSLTDPDLVPDLLVDDIRAVHQALEALPQPRITP
ncbi:MAG: HAD family hydrolase [Acidimicrobiales bacterium]